jgi:nucleoside-diphosphate-sugar epimerase
MTQEHFAQMRIPVTGGAGFIGSALCRYLVGQCGYRVLKCRQADLCCQFAVAGRRRRRRELSVRAA